VIVAPDQPRGRFTRALDPEPQRVFLMGVWLGETLRLLERDADSFRLIVDVEHEALGPLHDPYSTRPQSTIGLAFSRENREGTMNSSMKGFALRQAVAAAALCALWMTAGDVRAEANKAEHGLTERCGEAAADWFGRHWGKTGSGEEASFENHYSPRTNKCYVLLKYTMPRREPPLLVLHLFDINGNGSHELGRFSRSGADAPTQCEVMESACKSEEDWRGLARALMEE
jgi:hypothetical protein